MDALVSASYRVFLPGFDIVESVNSFKMTGIGGVSYVDATGDAPAAMNGVVVVSLIQMF